MGSVSRKMIIRFEGLALLGSLLALPSLITAEVTVIPSDTPISSLKSSANAFFKQGAWQDARSYLDAIIARDANDCNIFFQRGLTYVQQGRNAQAGADFDAALRINSNYKSALLQRGKLRARNADWASARVDYTAAGLKEEMQDLQEAEGASYLAAEAEKKRDWEQCISQAGTAILTASTSLSLRQLRARCRFERGDVQEGISDLKHVLQIHPGQVDPHLQISSMLFYSLGDTEQGVSQIKKCLHSDPDSKACKTLFRQEKAMMKTIDKISTLMQSRQFNSASKMLAGTGAEDEPGLLQTIKDEVAAAKASKRIHESSPNNLYAAYVEKTCECYSEMKSKTKAAPYCAEALQLLPTSLHGLLFEAQNRIDAENYDAAISSLNTAKDAHPDSQTVKQRLQEAHTLFKRSKTKDYYKVLDVPRDADDRTIKRAYRHLTKVHHPDKAIARGIAKEDAEKKMAGINEAYEVLSDPELKARFDRGDDPNDPTTQHGGHPFHGSPFGGQGGQQFVFQQGGFPGGSFQFKAGGGGGGGGGNPFAGFPGFG